RRAAARGSRPRSRPAATRRNAGLPSCNGLEVGDRDLLDVPERQLQEALAQLAEERRLARRQEAVGALAALAVLDSLARERLGHLTGGLLRREDEGHAAAEDALEDRPDQRVVRAAEDHRVDPRLLHGRRVLADGLPGLGGERVVALD